MPPPDPATYTPAGHPGARAPHLLIDAGSGPISALDRFGRDFVLVVAGPPGPWGAQPTIEILPGEPYELEPGGAALVRPDGHIAWRSYNAWVKPPEGSAVLLRGRCHPMWSPAASVVETTTWRPCATR